MTGSAHPTAEPEQRVTPLELFFDLVFVYAFTQVTESMSRDATWVGMGHGLLVLAALWWAWTGYAWLTNALEPEEGRVRVGMFAGMVAMMVVALAVPHAFGDDAVLFGVGFLLARTVNLALYVVSRERGPGLLGAVARFAAPAGGGAALLVAAGFAHGGARMWLWAAALVLIYGAAAIGPGSGWDIAPAHFAERYGLIVIIALGESVVAIGVGAAGSPIGAGLLTAAALGIVLMATLWWAYFDVYAVLGRRQLAETSGVVRTGLARDLYSYLHMPMIAGVVLFAFGLEEAVRRPGDPLAIVPATALCGGLALYFLSHVVIRVRIVLFLRRSTDQRPGLIGPGRLAAGIGSIALLPVARVVPAVSALASLAGVGCLLIAWDLIRYRDHRAEVRRDRG